MNRDFEETFSRDEDQIIFKGKMLWVWEGNHKVIVWCCHIDQFHANKIEWHYNVDCICFDPASTIGVLIDAMNHVNMLGF